MSHIFYAAMFFLFALVIFPTVHDALTYQCRHGDFCGTDNEYKAFLQHEFSNEAQQ